jgi:Tetratricopeptide repeat
MIRELVVLSSCIHAQENRSIRCHQEKGLRPICLHQPATFFARRLWVLLLTMLAPAGLCQSVATPPHARVGKTTARAADASAAYVGSQVCGKCHAGIYKAYEQTGMGRSISVITPSLLKTLDIPASYHDQKFDRRYEVYLRDGNLYQSESAADGDGNPIFRDEHQLQWIIGSGANVFGGIVRRDSYLFEAPLAFYTKPTNWELAPGYEFADLGFSRPILAGCIFCHSGRTRPVPATNGRFESEAFSELAIGCENCHGPGAAHLKAMANAGSYKEGNFSIVNPARLTPDMANNICMACHELGDERVQKPGKAYQDVRPGVPLDGVLSIFVIPPTRESPPQRDHLQHYYAMTLSMCYRASAGRLRCINCHDPHVQPSSQEAPAYFNPKCLGCHTERSCKLPLEARQQTRPADDCIGCHMPKRDIGFIAHSSLTNHRIPARPDEPFPDITFSQTTTSLPDLIHLNPAPGKKDVLPPLLTLLQAYGELAAYLPDYVAPYLRVLEELETTEPNDALVQAALGRRDLKNGKPLEAANHLRRALTLGRPQAVVYADLSEALDKVGQKEQALTMLRNAVQRDPFNPLFQRTMVFLLIDLKQSSQAQAAIERYLQTFPQDSFMRQKFALATGRISTK